MVRLTTSEAVKLGLIGCSCMAGALAIVEIIKRIDKVKKNSIETTTTQTIKLNHNGSLVSRVFSALSIHLKKNIVAISIFVPLVFCLLASLLWFVGAGLFTYAVVGPFLI